MDPHRAERLSEALREELDELIEYEMTDPRVSGVTVTDVVVSPDLRKAEVRLAMPPDDAVRKQAVAALEHARGFLRRELALRLQLYRIPDLYFAADLSTGLASRVESLLKRVRKGRPRDEQQG
ncbi:MAG TPA: 30S ribosome-binding factor RbfA [Bryobacteraceae bacterium]|jgi:ribosome-binding factor A|nr:30S ribosome-binding factor RbfA [Bryobacteraceae bacterium]